MMMLIDMTNELGSLLAILDVALVIAATGIAVSAWHHQRTSLTGNSIQAVVGDSSSARESAEAPSDTSVSEAA